MILINHMKNFFYISILFLLPLSASAQTLFLSAPEDVKTGESFTISVELDSGSTLVNSASVELAYDQSLFSFRGYQSDETVLALWVNAPKEKDGHIYFSGIIPGGVAGEYDPGKSGVQDVTLTKLLFTANAPGTGKFSIFNSQVLKHDGRGTELDHDTREAQIKVTDELAQGDQVEDIEKPLPFALTYLDAGFFSRTPSMIIFEARDVGSGIKEYKIKTGFSTWRTGESPFAVARGFFPKEVTVRAVDYAGNWQEASLYIPGLMHRKIFIGLFVVALLCIAAYKMIK